MGQFLTKSEKLTSLAETTARPNHNISSSKLISKSSRAYSPAYARGSVEFLQSGTGSSQNAGTIVTDLPSQERRYDQPCCISAQVWCMILLIMTIRSTRPLPLLSTSLPSSQATAAQRRSEVSPLANVKYKSQWPAVAHTIHGLPPLGPPTDHFPAVSSPRKLHYTTEKHNLAFQGAFLDVPAKAVR